MQLTAPEVGNDRVTIISGGTQGLGEAVARRLAADGAAGLVIGGRTVELGERLAAELSEGGTQTVYVEVDTIDASAPRQLVNACAERFGTVHGAVNVAAKTSRATLFNDTPEHFDEMFACNTRAPYFLTQAAAELMISTGQQGSIVNIGSTSSFGGQPKLGAYSASKGALAIVTKNTAFALMRNGVRVNQVNPGWMETLTEHRTQTIEDGAPENWLAQAAPTMPLGRLVQPWEVAAAVAFFLSPASGMMTGNIVNCDQSVQGAGDPPYPSAAETVSPGDEPRAPTVRDAR